VLRGSVQDLSHIRPLGIGWTNRVLSGRQGNIAVRSQIHDHLGSVEEAVHMAWHVVVGIENELNAAKTK